MPKHIGYYINSTWVENTLITSKSLMTFYTIKCITSIQVLSDIKVMWFDYLYVTLKVQIIVQKGIL